MQGTQESSVRRVVVLGATMAGLAVARVLADHFDEVVLVERDALPTGADCRKGTPQGRHLHGLLQSGPQVRCLDDHDVLGLLSTPDRGMTLSTRERVMPAGT